MNERTRNLYTGTVIAVFLTVLFTSQYYYWKSVKETVKVSHIVKENCK